MKRGMLRRNVIVDMALLTKPNDGTLERIRISRSPLAIMVPKATDPAGQDCRKTGRMRHC